MSNPAVSAGVKFGAIIVALGIVSRIISVVFTQALGTPPAAGDPEAARAYLEKAGPTLLLLAGFGIVFFVVNVVLFLMAGRSAAKQTGTVGSGAIAGLIAGVLGGIVGAIIEIVLSAAGISTSPSSTGTVLSASALLAITIGAAIFGILIDAGIGAGLGALGGLMGRSAFQATAATTPMGVPGAYPPPPGGYPPQPMQ